MYQIEVETLDHLKGTRDVKVLPKKYKTHANALRSARWAGYTFYGPDGKTPHKEANCRIITL